MCEESEDCMDTPDLISFLTRALYLVLWLSLQGYQRGYGR